MMGLNLQNDLLVAKQNGCLFVIQSSYSLNYYDSII
jgi:hypothetical protein